MTGTEEAKQRSGESRVGKDPLLSCLSRLILETHWTRADHSTKSHSRTSDSGVISRALVRETLSFAGAGPNFTAAGRDSIQTPVLSHT